MRKLVVALLFSVVLLQQQGCCEQHRRGGAVELPSPHGKRCLHLLNDKRCEDVK